ncbi:MAG TPA: DUF5666 domain-containing protein [Thermoanaerobaculia bacterium]|jgi:hypothetical protein|nr:DUF5666 domain-containing protein [Thermoanaerobaculia bacterium]
MTRSTSILFLSILLLPAFASAATRHRVTAPPAAIVGDALGVGTISGASISGTVLSVQGTTIVLQTGGAPPIRIDASSARFVSTAALASISDVAPGARITAFVRDDVSGAGPNLTAALIVIETVSDLEISGPVSAIDAAHGTLTVLGVVISTDSTTTFGSAFPTFAPIRGVSDLAIGQVVGISASFAGVLIHADRVMVLAPLAPIPTTFTGTVKSMSASEWVITTAGTDTRVVVNGQTKILGDPKIGDTVQVLATVDSAHQTVAVAIVNVGVIRPPSSVELHGFVKSITPEQWVIGGPPGSLAPDFLVRITPLTILYPNPAVGDRVAVHAVQVGDGAPVAIAISREP